MKLYGWTNYIRSSYREINKGKRLSQEQIYKIESLDGWKWKKMDSDSLFDEYVDKLKLFIKVNSRYPKNSSENKEERSLFQWVVCMRRTKNGTLTNRVPLTEEKIKILEEIEDWYWSIEKIWNSSWIDKLEKTKNFIETKKKIPSPSSSDKTEKRLGQWFHQQRSRVNFLSEEKINLIEQKIPKWLTLKFDVENDVFEGEVFKIRNFFMINNRFPRYTSEGEEKRLYNFLMRCKRCYNNPEKYSKDIKLTDERIEILNRNLQEWL